MKKLKRKERVVRKKIKKEEFEIIKYYLKLHDINFNYLESFERDDCIGPPEPESCLEFISELSLPRSS